MLFVFSKLKMDVLHQMLLEGNLTSKCINVCKPITVSLLPLVYFSAKQTLSSSLFSKKNLFNPIYQSYQS